MTPVVFTYMEKFRGWLGRRRGPGRRAEEPTESHAPAAEEERIPAVAAMRSATPGT